MPDNSIIPSNPKLVPFTTAKEQIALLADQCKNFTINNDETLEGAESLAKNAKKIGSMIEDKRKEITAPLVAEKKEIDDYAKSLTNNLDSAIKLLRDQILKYKMEQEAKRQAELKRLEEERRQKEEELRQLAEANKIDEVKQEDIDKVIQLREEVKQVESAPAPKGISKVWTFEILSESLVPREYLTIDEKKIKVAISTGVREIAGVKIYQKEQLSLR
jgi:cupin superfamily acireductone dioxygenase involved in methionine salvage